ncbi:MAG: hypothetical protein AAB339_09595, partial [Elusimicrobiota bacterium]
MRFQQALASLIVACLLVSMPGPGVYHALAQQQPVQVQGGPSAQGIAGFIGPRSGVSAVPGDLGRMTLSPGTALPSLSAAAFVPGRLAAPAAPSASRAQAAQPAVSAVSVETKASGPRIAGPSGPAPASPALPRRPGLATG